MSVNYYWNILNINTSSMNDLENVVVSISWQAIITGTSHIVSANGAVFLDPPNIENFISFDQLTQTQFENWIRDKTDIIKLENYLAGLSTQPPLTGPTAPPQSVIFSNYIPEIPSEEGNLPN